MVKNYFFILLLFVFTNCSGQDSLMLQFMHLSAEITQENTSQIKDFFKDRKAERVLINAYFSDEGSASKNRILAEMRLYVTRSAIMNEGVPFNIINSYIKTKKLNSPTKTVEVIAFFKPAKGEKVLRKSSIVEVSVVDYRNSGESKNDRSISNEQVENEIVLDEAAFKKNATVSLPNLIFVGSTHYFLSSSERVLRALLKVMKARPDIEIQLQGHVCCNPPGVDAYNKITGLKNLSVSRARAVYDYLIEGGISADRMTYRGFGSSRRLYPEEKNATEQMLNRRVEVLITASDSK